MAQYAAGPVADTTEFTREQLEQGITDNIDVFNGPAKLSADAIETIISQGRVADNGFIVVQDEIFGDDANIGSSGVFFDPIGNIRVLGVSPEITDREVREVVAEEVDRIGDGVAVFDPNDLDRAFTDFQNGNTTAIELVENGGLPSAADLAEETVDVDGATIDAAIEAQDNGLVIRTAIQSLTQDDARQLIDERGVLTDNGFVVVEDDQFTLFDAAGGDTGIEGGLIIDPINDVIFKGSAEEIIAGGDPLALVHRRIQKIQLTAHYLIGFASTFTK